MPFSADLMQFMPLIKILPSKFIELADEYSRAAFSHEMKVAYDMLYNEEIEHEDKRVLRHILRAAFSNNVTHVHYCLNAQYDRTQPTTKEMNDIIKFLAKRLQYLEGRDNEKLNNILLVLSKHVGLIKTIAMTNSAPANTAASSPTETPIKVGRASFYVQIPDLQLLPSPSSLRQISTPNTQMHRAKESEPKPIICKLQIKDDKQIEMPDSEMKLPMVSPTLREDIATILCHEERTYDRLAKPVLEELRKARQQSMINLRDAYRKSHTLADQARVLVHYDPNIFQESAVSLNRTLCTDYNPFIASKKAQEWRHTSKHREVTSSVSCFADGLGTRYEEPFPFTLTTASMLNLSHDGRDYTKHVTSGDRAEAKLLKPYQTKGLIDLLIRRCLMAQDSAGVSVAIIPWDRVLPYLQKLPQDQQDEFLLTMGTVTRKILKDSPLRSITAVILALSQPKNVNTRLARLYDMPLLAESESYPTLYICNDEPLRLASELHQNKIRAGIINLGSDRILGGLWQHHGLSAVEEDPYFELVLFQVTNAGEVQSLDFNAIANFSKKKYAPELQIKLHSQHAKPAPLQIEGEKDQNIDITPQSDTTTHAVLSSLSQAVSQPLPNESYAKEKSICRGILESLGRGIDKSEGKLKVTQGVTIYDVNVPGAPAVYIELKPIKRGQFFKNKILDMIFKFESYAFVPDTKKDSCTVQMSKEAFKRFSELLKLYQAVFQIRNVTPQSSSLSSKQEVKEEVASTKSQDEKTATKVEASKTIKSTMLQMVALESDRIGQIYNLLYEMKDFSAVKGLLLEQFTKYQQDLNTNAKTPPLRDSLIEYFKDKVDTTPQNPLHVTRDTSNREEMLRVTLSRENALGQLFALRINIFKYSRFKHEGVSVSKSFDALIKLYQSAAQAPSDQHENGVNHANEQDIELQSRSNTPQNKNGH